MRGIEKKELQRSFSGISGGIAQGVGVLLLAVLLSQCPDGKDYHGSTEGSMNPPSGKELLETQQETAPEDTLDVFQGEQRDSEHPYE